MSNADKTHPKKSAPNSDSTHKESDLWDLDDNYNASASKVPALKSLTEVKQPTEIEQPNQKAAKNLQLKKTSLTLIEKIALFCFAMMLICGGVLGYVWLYKKNELSKISYTIDLPAKGTYATLTEFSTYWKPANDFSGVIKTASVIPVANVTLDKSSTSGILRCYFYDNEKAIVGDAVTVNFTDGLFDNGKNTLEIAANDGFTSANDMLAYQMEPSLTWRIIIKEAASQNATGNEFKTLVETNISTESRSSGE